MHWLYLAIAIVAEVAGSIALKQSDAFTRVGPSALTVAAVVTALFFLALALRTIPLGVAYAIWAGAGIVLISIVGVVVFRQSLDLPAMIGIALIVSGMIVINMLSSSTTH
ncbi:multidrug efflux SMR transporter [Exilibacterium tricleocarpae]|uniref:Multidrug efflux SMR transporter n=1 Tax=Exilibacterium tricleocarpae TaxID=2591008 RepID=A0A545U997_9GAMM|nr:multidrug efflux SMR transporter [Exilibacterium tricleocarpae]TQV86046.1 multidrug efflux SMR transporter [Exilibacterium tricleocarpae]